MVVFSLFLLFILLFLFIYFKCMSLLCPFLAKMSLAGFFPARFILPAFPAFFLRICYVPGLVWFGPVYLVTTVGFVGDRSI